MELIDYNTLADIERGDGYIFGKVCDKTKTSLKYLENKELCGKFEGVDIFLNALTDTSLKTGKYGNSSRKMGKNGFNLFETYAEAMDTFKNNPSKVANFIEKDDKILGGDSAGMGVEYDVTGDFIDMGRYVEGIPETFGNMYNGNPRSKRVNILIPAMVSWGVDHELINKRSERVKRLVDWLETNQVRCAVTIVFTNDNWHCEIVVKKFDEVFNINDIAIATHSEFFRRCQFKFGENSPVLADGYGSSICFWHNTRLEDIVKQEYNNEFNVVIGGKLIYVDQIDNNMNELEKELKKRIFEDQNEENFIGCMLGG
nr:MAG TPA: hypothetical protein [Caudoviricetes sp.]